MPLVEFENENGETETIACEKGDSLRDALLDEGLSPHNIPTAVSCHGLGTCATCSVVINEGEVGKPSLRERVRLDLPVASPDVEARLACQVTVTDGIKVSKPEGVWGKGTE
jgi:ferredoxin